MSNKKYKVKRIGPGLWEPKWMTAAELGSVNYNYTILDEREGGDVEELAGEAGEEHGKDIKELEHIYDSSSRSSAWLTDAEEKRVEEYKQSKKKNQKSAKTEWKESIEEETGMSPQEAFEEVRSREAGGQFNTEPSDDISKVKNSLKTGGRNSNWEQIADSIEEKKAGESEEESSEELSEEELQKRKAAIEAFRDSDSEAFEKVADELEQDLSETQVEHTHVGELGTRTKHADGSLTIETQDSELVSELENYDGLIDIDDSGEGVKAHIQNPDELREELSA